MAPPGQQVNMTVVSSAEGVDVLLDHVPPGPVQGESLASVCVNLDSGNVGKSSLLQS
jgi:hypothetical protein